MIYEENVIQKDPMKVDIRFASVYPNIYKTAMSSLGYRIIYGLINEREDTYCERVIYPDTRSIESNSPLKDFDIISFSLQYEQDYFNVLEILKNANIPIKRENRCNSKIKYPLVMAGGPCATSNPLPLSKFIDFFIIGEGEAILNKFLDEYKKIFKNNKIINNKAIDINSLHHIKGVYSPNSNIKSFDSEYDTKKNHKSNRAEIAIVKNMEDAYYTTWPLITKTTDIQEDKNHLPVFGNSILLNVSRGCTRGCRFCMSGYLYRPFRKNSLDLLFKIAEKTRENTGENKVSLIGAAVSDYSRINELVEGLLKRNFQVSTPSLRIESITKETLVSLKESGSKTITIAPESIYKLRKSLNKNISDDKIEEIMKDALELGFNIKLYFLIGIPNETKGDIEELANYIKYLDSLKSRYSFSSNKNSIKFSVNPLIPKPHTPLQWEGYNLNEVKKKTRYLKSLLKNINIKFDSPKMGLIQYVLSCKGLEVGNLIEKSLKTKIPIKEWEKFSKGYNINEKLPWEDIDIHINNDFLKKEYTNISKGETLEWCIENHCYNCGSCDNL